MVLQRCSEINTFSLHPIDNASITVRPFNVDHRVLPLFVPLCRSPPGDRKWDFLGRLVLKLLTPGSSEMQAIILCLLLLPLD